MLREAFQSKKQRNLGIRHLGGGGAVKKSKKSQVSVGKSSKLGGGSSEIKKVPSSRGYQRLKKMTHFHLMRTQKHKILSLIVLNMAKYTIISLILIDFVPIFFILNFFRRIFRWSFRLKKVPSSKKSQVDFKGWVNPFQ